MPASLLLTFEYAVPGLLGLAVVCVVLQDVFEVMLLPRRVQRRTRLVGLFYRVSWRFWTALAPGGERRGVFLGNFGALSMVVLILLWTTALVTGFALLHWSVQGTVADHPRSPFLEQLYMSGSTFFTLGYGDVVPRSALSRLLAVVEAGLGLGFIATVISYLPVIHQFFSRREAYVMELDSRAGSPPTALTLLSRHADPADLPLLVEYLREWEGWAAQLLESHLSYPMLAFYRSQHGNQSWLGALACMLDTTSLLLVGVRNVHRMQPRLTFSASRQVLVEMARAFYIQPASDCASDRMDAECYRRLEQALLAGGVEWDAGDHSRDTLATLRATYEPLLQALSERFHLDVPGWLPSGNVNDNWKSGPRGLTAGWLVHELTTGTTPAPLAGEGPVAHRLLTRMHQEPPDDDAAKPDGSARVEPGTPETSGQQGSPPP